MHRTRAWKVGLSVVALAACSDGPRSFDASELTPLLDGTTVVDAPREGCPNGAEPIGDCDAVARINDRDGVPALDVIRANALEAGFIEDDNPGTWLLQARDEDRCLFVSESSHVQREPGELHVFLGWC